jgi:hypothetical protein
MDSDYDSDSDPDNIFAIKMLVQNHRQMKQLKEQKHISTNMHNFFPVVQFPMKAMRDNI